MLKRTSINSRNQNVKIRIANMLNAFLIYYVSSLRQDTTARNNIDPLCTATNI